MERPQFTPEQIASVHIQMTVTDLINEFYQEYGDDAFKVTRKFAFRLGNNLGLHIKEVSKVTATDANAVASVLNASLHEIVHRIPGPTDFKVAGNEVVSINDGYCSIREGANVVKSPLDKICPNYGWHMIEGIAAAVNPEVKHEIPESRALGDSRCRHVFIVP